MGAEEEVIAAAKERASALAVGDAERLSGLLHEDFRWTTHMGETYNRSEYVRRNTEGHTVWRSQDLSSAEVVVVGDTAVLFAEVADVVLSGDDQGRDLPDADDAGLGAFGRPLDVPRGSRGATAVLTSYAAFSAEANMRLTAASRTA